MIYNTIKVETEGAIATVTLNRPDRLNAVNYEMIEELTAAAGRFRKDHSVNAIILTGEGRAFSAGHDLSQPAPRGTIAEQRELHQIGRFMCRAWEELPQVTIAAIHGPAVGAGVALAISCDWRVMSEDAYLYVPEVRIGLTLQMQAIPRLIALVGPARTKRIVMLCEKMPPRQALEWGLIEEIAPAGDDYDAALRLAKAACKMPSAIMTLTKEAINATANANLHATSFMDSDVSMLIFNTEEAVEARKKFVR